MKESKRLQVFQEITEQSLFKSRTIEIPINDKLEEKILNIAMQIGDVANYQQNQSKQQITYYDLRYAERAMQYLACFDPQVVQDQEFNDDLVVIEGNYSVKEVEKMLIQYGDISQIYEKAGAIFTHFYDIRAAIHARNEKYLLQRCLTQKIIDLQEEKDDEQDIYGKYQISGKENQFHPYYNQFMNTQHNLDFSLQCMPLYEGNFMFDPVIAMMPPRQNSIIKDNRPNYFNVDVCKVMRGVDTRSSLMVKNIPNKYSQVQLLEEITRRMKINWHADDFLDFFYLPIDFQNKRSMGYAFINIVSTEYIINFYMEFVGKGWELYNSKKMCQLTYARIQGSDALIEHFMNSNVMNVSDNRLKPIIFGFNTY